MTPAQQIAWYENMAKEARYKQLLEQLYKAAVETGMVIPDRLKKDTEEALGIKVTEELKL